MTWSTSEIEYEGFPLLLRKPDYENIWQYKAKLTQLISVEHLLEEVAGDGLPASGYNKSLSEFDNCMCTIFEKNTDGIIFLIETFAGKRNYYYYTQPYVEFQLEKIVKKFNVKLSLTVKPDRDWGFIDVYPVELYR